MHTYIHPPTHPYTLLIPHVSSLPPTQHPPPIKQKPKKNRCTSTYTHHIGTINFLSDGSMVYGAGDGSHFQGIGACVRV